MLAKLAWRILTEKNSLCARIIRAKYFHNKDPLCDKLTVQGSWIWRSIYKGIQTVRRFYSWNVGDGTEIKIWKHKWIAKKEHQHLSQAAQHQNDEETVQSLINQHTKEWNWLKINQLFNSDERKKIRDIRIPKNTRDSLVWSLTRNGKFTVQSTYTALIQGGNPVNKEDQKFWLKLWHVKLPYKLNLFLWRCMKDILQTRDRLGRHMQIEDYSCPFCGISNETDDHILMHCHLARVIWFALLPEAMHTHQQFTSLQSWIKSWNQDQSVISFKNERSVQLATVIMWHIWKQRCTTVFEGEEARPNNIIRAINNFCNKYNLLNCETNSVCRNTLNKSRSKWQKPQENWWKLNFDAAFDKETNICGMGLILRDCAGNFLEALVKVTRARDAEQGESLALWEAAYWIKMKNWSNIIIEGDCKTVIEAVTSNFARSNWQDHNLLADISRLIESCSSVRCVFVPRTSNEVADGLVKYAKKNLCNQVWSEDPPRCIITALQLDNSL